MFRMRIRKNRLSLTESPVRASATVRLVGRELNVRYVLEGSVQRSGKRRREKR